jgi:hypothetical protein
LRIVCTISRGSCTGDYVRDETKGLMSHGSTSVILLGYMIISVILDLDYLFVDKPQAGISYLPFRNDFVGDLCFGWALAPRS